MADFSALKTAIQTYIKQNGNEEITGEILQEILLSVVTTLGDTAINNLVTALADEVAARQNADGTLQQNITNEATARGNADTALSNRLGSTITAENTAAEQIGEEAEAREAADTALQGLIDGITDNIENGYVYAGIATPSSTPTTGKVFYLALTAGTYTNFGSTVVTQGINILKYNGSAWSLDAFIGIDDTPTPNSPKLVKSGGVFDKVMTDGSAFDISAYFASGGTLATYADLSAALTALNSLSADYKRGGMSIKFVQSSDNKYVQYRLMSDTFNTTPSNWQGVDDTPTAGSHNLVESGGVVLNMKGLKAIGTDFLLGKVYITDGSLIDNVKYAVSPYLILSQSETICRFKSNSVNYGIWAYIFFDKNKSFISLGNYGAAHSEVDLSKINIPSNAFYVRFILYDGGSHGQLYPQDVADWLLYYGDIVDVKTSISEQETRLSSVEDEIRGEKLQLTLNKLINNEGDDISVNGWARTDKIPVVGGEIFTFSQNDLNYGIWAINQYDANENWVRQVNLTSANLSYQYNAVEGISYLVLDIYGIPKQDPLTPENTAEWELRKVDGNCINGKISEIEEELNNGNSVSVNVDFSQKLVKITSALSSKYNIENSIGWKDENGITYNPCANYKGTSIISRSTGTKTLINAEEDNISATNLNNVGFIGANHGLYRNNKATVPSHGKSYEDIGSKWSIDDKIYVLIQIIDSNTLGLLPMYTTDADGIKHFEGTLNASDVLQHVSGATHTSDITISSSTIGYWQPIEKIVKRGCYVDGKEVSVSGTYEGSVFDLIEVYDVIDPASFLDAVIAAVGTLTSNPLPKNFSNLNSWLRYSNDYRFSEGGLNVLLIDWIAMSKINFNMFFPLDVKPMVDNALGGGLQYYLPKALPIIKNGVTYDYRIPASFSTVAAPLTWVPDYWENPLLPPDRGIEFIDNGTKRIIGLHHGYVFNQGVACGVNRKDYLRDAWWINDTRAVYNGALEGVKIGNIHEKGTHYGLCCYRKYEDYTDNPSGLISLSQFEVNGRYYVYADFEAAGEYELKIPAKWQGKELKILEKSDNVELISSMSVSPMLAIVSSASPMYGYVVLEINKNAVE